MKQITKNPLDIVIFQDKSRNVILRGDDSGESVWATQKQIAELFGIDRTVVTKHINNILKDREVTPESNVQKMHIANSDKPVTLYGLDIILSVGYRTNSSSAIRFRQWATKRLRDYILKGYAINEQRLRTIHDAKLSELEKTIQLITGVREKIKNQDEAKGLLSVINDYTQTWILLNQYDQRDIADSFGKKSRTSFDFEKLSRDITVLKEALIASGEASAIFGQDRGAFSGIVKSVFQTFNKKELYPTIESKAAHLLYFIIKDHPFVDGNKRIGAFTFLTFLISQNYLFRKNGERKINDVGLTALALLIAGSDPEDKEQLVRLVMRLIG